MSRRLAVHAQNTLKEKGYRVEEFVYIPRTFRSEEGWAIVVTGPNGDAFREKLGGVAVTADALFHAALTMPTCDAFMAGLEVA